MKRNFTDFADKIWNQIMGKKGLGISSARAENLVLILEREIGLVPTMIRVDDTYHLYTSEGLKRINVTSRLDGSVAVFYLPQDCEEATGSQAQNWLQWSSRLLGYKRKSHEMAPRFRPPVEVLDVLHKRGITKGRRRLDIRFLSLELVIFYIAAQTRTWENPGRILTVKSFIEKHDIDTEGYTPAQEEIDVDDLFPNDGTHPPPVKPSGIPKAGQGLLNYNPTAQAEAENEDLKAQADEGNVKVETKDPVADAADALFGSEEDEAGGLEDSLLDNEIKATRRKLAELVYKRRTRKFADEARQGKVIDGKPWPDQPRWAIVTMEFPNGKTATYLDAEIVCAGLGGNINAEDLVDAAIGKAEVHILDKVMEHV